MKTEQPDWQRRCAELEQQLREAEQKAAYYQQLAERAGITRLRETEELSRLLDEAQRMRATLAQSEAQLRQVIDLVPHMIFVKNREGRFLLVNKTVASSLNTTVEALTGQLHADAHPRPEEVAQMLADDRKVIESGEMVVIPEEMYTTHTGETRWLQTIKVPYVTADTAEPAVLGVAIDITEHKRIQASLRASEQRFRDLFENSPDAIFVEDALGYVLDVNSASCQLHQMERQELIGKNVLDLVPPELQADVAHEFPKEVLGRLPRIESLSLRKDGTSVPVEICTSPFTYAGQPAVLLHVRDITHRKQIEAELQQYREHLEELVQERTLKLEQEIAERKRIEEQLTLSLREKAVLLKEIHHRVKNNLQVISSLLYLQAGRVQDPGLQSIFQESRARIRAMTLVHEKLYQSGNFAQIRIRAYIESLIFELYRAYGVSLSQVELVLTLDDLVLGIDTAIPCGLILNELVSNALKYAFPHGSGRIAISLSGTPDRRYELAVSDNGIGMPPDLKIEDLDSLGLQLVQGLAEEQLRGTLHLERESGTTWRIRFQAED